jgi:hypothetical protein
VRARARGAWAAGVTAAAAAAAACVRVDPGPNGVASARVADAPPSVVVGDVLRDANGEPTVLRAEGFDESGRPVSTAPVRFVYLPTRRDSLGRLVPDTALVVDSLSGAVRARNAFVSPEGVVAVRVGERLQILDTLAIVPRPDSVSADTAVTLALRFDCADTARRLAARPLAPVAGGFDTLYAYNALGPFRVRVRGDSASTRVNVRRRLVRWRVVTPRAVPSVRLPGGSAADTVPAIGVVSTDVDRLTGLDTTDNGGLSAVRLRIRQFGLGRSAIPTDTFTVRLVADAQPGPGPLAGRTQTFEVRLARRPGATGAGCQ